MDIPETTDPAPHTVPVTKGPWQRPVAAVAGLAAIALTVAVSGHMPGLDRILHGDEHPKTEVTQDRDSYELSQFGSEPSESPAGTRDPASTRTGDAGNPGSTDSPTPGGNGVAPQPSGQPTAPTEPTGPTDPTDPPSSPDEAGPISTVLNPLVEEAVETLGKNTGGRTDPLTGPVKDAAGQAAEHADEVVGGTVKGLPKTPVTPKVVSGDTAATPQVPLP